MDGQLGIQKYEKKWITKSYKVRNMYRAKIVHIHLFV